MELLSLILLGLALAATCGLRIFLPLLSVGLAAHFHLIMLQPDFTWLAGSCILACFAIAAIAEITAGYIPHFHTAFEFIRLPLALAAGAILSTAVLPIQDPVMRWAAGLVGGGVVAGIIHVSTSLLYLVPSKKPDTAIRRRATQKNILAFFGILLAIFLPLAPGILAILIAVWLGNRIITKFKPFARH